MTTPARFTFDEAAASTALDNPTDELATDASFVYELDYFNPVWAETSTDVSDLIALAWREGWVTGPSEPFLVHDGDNSYCFETNLGGHLGYDHAVKVATFWEEYRRIVGRDAEGECLKGKAAALDLLSDMVRGMNGMLDQLDRFVAATAPTSLAPDVAALLAEYDEWREDRADLSAAERPDSDDWHLSDDTGCDLASRMADALRSLTGALTKQAADWRKAADDCDPGREANDSIEDCEGTAMAGVYSEAAEAVEKLIAHASGEADDTPPAHPLVGKTIASVSDRQMVGKDTQGEYHDWTETTFTFTDGTTHKVAEDNTDLLGEAQEPETCEACTDTIVKDGSGEWVHPFGYSTSDDHDARPEGDDPYNDCIGMEYRSFLADEAETARAPKCGECGAPVELADEDDPDSWIHADGQPEDGHTATLGES